MDRVFEQGDIVYLSFDPQAGHEQRGMRPAVIVSTGTFNKFTRLALVCPITNTNRALPLHVALDRRTTTSGVIMCEQVKSLDVIARNATFFERVPQDILREVVDIIASFVEE